MAQTGQNIGMTPITRYDSKHVHGSPRRGFMRPTRQEENSIQKTTLIQRKRYIEKNQSLCICQNIQARLRGHNYEPRLHNRKKTLAPM